MPLANHHAQRAVLVQAYAGMSKGQIKKAKAKAKAAREAAEAAGLKLRCASCSRSVCWR